MIPNDFLREETRCGFLVTRERKEIWAVELDLLERFIRFCDDHDLKYFINGGSMLGAVRHDGYIPWDDDIDVGMDRKDYEKLISLASEFEAPYFLQANETDKAYYRGHAQLRNSNTTAILRTEAFTCDFNQGIFIDIFPMDRLDFSDPETVSKLTKAGRIYTNINWHRTFRAVKKHSLAGWAKYLLLSAGFAFGGYDRANKKHDELCRSCWREDGVNYDNEMNNHEIERFRYLYSEHLEFIPHKFEYLTVMIPKDYDAILSRQYGDYMTPVHSDTTHGAVIFDPHRPYTEVLAEIRSGQRSIYDD